MTAAATGARIARLRAEARDDSPAVATPTPRLSWTVETPGTDWVQAWAELRDDTGATTRVEGRDSVLVAWPFEPLSPDTTRTLEVRAGSTSGEETRWSAPLAVEAAFLAEGTWTAGFIGLAAPERAAQPMRIRRSFTVDRPVRRARLVWTALGAAEPQLNGTLVSADVLSPGWTAYGDRLVHETIDVTALIEPGENVVAATVAGAWYTERYGFFQFAKRIYGEQPLVAAQLQLDYADGTSATIVTDDSWSAADGADLVDSGIYAGEAIDTTLAEPGWATTGFDASGWSAALVDDAAHPVPEARIAAPVRRIEERAVAEVLTAPSGATILDFGQNLVGRLRVTVSGPRGTVLTLRHAEVLDEGELALRPLRNAAATDHLTLSGDGEQTLEPRFTFHGFRYAQIDGWPGDVDPSAVTAVVLHSDLTRTGWFSSSHELLDRLHENVVWGMRGNFLSIPTDCPQRDERLGWTGDLQVFAPTASFLYDSSAFLDSWLRDLALEQGHADGVVPMVVPAALSGFAGGGPTAAWGDAATVVPWVLHERYGDLGVLREQYASMRSWVEAVLRVSTDGLWSNTFQLGDWLDPSAPPDQPAKARVDSDIVASAYHARSLRILSDTAALLGETADAEHYGALADRSRAAFAAEYVTPAGRMMSDAPTAYALALRFDLVDDPGVRRRLADRLADLVRADGYRIGTGFVGTPLITDALTDGGHLRAAGRLMLQTENPSWLSPVTKGATTVWERWDSLLEDGSVNPGEMTSFNHYALGAVADWLHRTVAGLAPAAPGYRELRIAPQPIDGLDHAEARHLTPYGPASVAWRREGSSLVVTAEVPPNTTATVALPGAPVETVGSGRYEWTVPVVETTALDDTVELDLESPLSEIIDRPTAYDALLAAVARHDQAKADEIRRGTQWSRGRTVRQLLMFTPPTMLDDVAAALATASAAGVAR
ncbi:alpha-L-rhamnosidase [Plantibacter sp. Leaf171]|uniref:family 78 glycoside hydrolase catalytic domain n=1 Tax=unclassified Plantibacter TaxID=2624265 RepID=UPI0006FDFFC8|nr:MULTISPECIES: family 78 glycoside hydrolase catalytic domain [unclassified Plantibacter]KQM16541.1 alpha-L-rhamnosidase [Plantibacter sp. Leaf1]KQR59676.1 alpha-L-rhamnosidase [Plantibacter sp. Leaf171]